MSWSLMIISLRDKKSFIKKKWKETKEKKIEWNKNERILLCMLKEITVSRYIYIYTYGCTST